MPDQHALLSPSSAHRWMHCTRAPRLEEKLPERISKDAEEGRLAHSVCELAARRKFLGLHGRTYNAQLKKLKEHPLWDDEMLSTAAAYVEHLAEQAMRFEHAPYIALEVQVDIADYVPASFGTCDCAMIGGDELIITDYKHGKGVPVSAENNPQMMLYALGALKLYHPIYGDAIRRVSCCIDQPRLGSYGGASMAVEELLAWGESIKPIGAAAFAGEGEFKPGDWCQFCRAKAQCRARADQNTALEDFKDCAPAGSVSGEVSGGHPLLSNEEIGGLLVRAEDLVAWYNDLKDFALRVCLDGGMIPGWKAVEGRSKTTFAPDYDTAAAVLIAAGYDRAMLYRETPENLSALDKLVGGRDKLKDLLGEHLCKSAGAPALALATDKRPALNSAASDFAGVSA